MSRVLSRMFTTKVSLISSVIYSKTQPHDFNVFNVILSMKITIKIGIRPFMTSMGRPLALIRLLDECFCAFYGTIIGFGTGQHHCDLIQSTVTRNGFDDANRPAFIRLLVHHMMRIGIGRYLWQVCDAYHLAVAGQVPQLLPDDLAAPAADADINLVEDHNRYVIGLGDGPFKRQREARHLAGGGYPGQGLHRLPRVSRDEGQSLKEPG